MPYQSAKTKASDLPLSVNLLPKENSVINIDNCNQEVTVLNYGTPEYDKSSFPGMMFDAEGAVRLLQYFVNSEESTQLLDLNKERNVYQFNFGFAPPFSPDNNRQYSNNTVLPKPVMLGLKITLKPAEKAASLVLHKILGVVHDHMQMFIDQNLNGSYICSNLNHKEGRPMNDEKRNKEFCDELNKFTGSQVSRGEAFSLNLQYLGPTEDSLACGNNHNVEQEEDKSAFLLAGHVDRSNCSMPGYNIVCTFKCFLEVDGGKFCLTEILYTRSSCSSLMKKEFGYAKYIYENVEEYQVFTLKNLRYEQISLHNIFKRGVTPQVGEVVFLALVPNTEKGEKSYPFHWVARAKKPANGTYFRVWLVPSLVTPRGWISCFIHAYREILQVCPLTHRQSLAFLYIFCFSECQVKPWYVLTRIWLPEIMKHRKFEATG